MIHNEIKDRIAWLRQLLSIIIYSDLINCQTDSMIGALKSLNRFVEKMIPCKKILCQWIDKGFIETSNIDLVLKAHREIKSSKNWNS